MKRNRWILYCALFISLVVSPCMRSMCAQAKPVPVAEKASPAVSGLEPVKDAELASMQEQLYRLLRMSPRLTSALSYDPSLLRYPDYVNTNNPELASFLQIHPEIARNPEYYLFSRLPGGRSGRVPYLFQRAVWPEFDQSNSMNDVTLLLIFLVILFAILWLLRLFMQNRRWNRIFKVQTEIHTKLLDKFGGSQELFTYLGTDTGRKFLELAPIAAAMESPQRPGIFGPVSRILAPLQLGIVSMLAGFALLIIKGYFRDSGALLLVGTMALALGIGFIFSAGCSWILARRFGLVDKFRLENADLKHE